MRRKKNHLLVILPKPRAKLNSKSKEFKLAGPSSDYGQKTSNIDSGSMGFNYSATSLQEHEGSNLDESDASSANWVPSDNSYGNFSDNYYYYNQRDVTHFGSGSS